MKIKPSPATAGMLGVFGASALFLAASLSTPQAHAQSAIMAALPDVIGQTIAGMSAGWPKECLALERKESPDAVARFEREAEPGLRAYLDLAGKGVDPTPAYKRRQSDSWAIDGAVVKDLGTISDPWAGKAARLERVGLILGRSQLFGHGIWRAYDTGGALLGTYDTDLIRKTKGYAVMRLRLWSPGQEQKATSLTPFCAEPGDHEAWAEARAAAEAKKAQRRAEREAAARQGAN